jgi:uncharacterized membrane protein
MFKNYLKNFIQNHPLAILGIAILVYIIFFVSLTIWKYHNFGYNGIDLGIFNQVFWNTAHGHFFTSSIQAQSYLGDHFELFILLLLPFYWLFQHPITLLVLQTIFLALGAIPIYLISKETLKTPPNSPLLRGRNSESLFIKREPSESAPLSKGGRGDSLSLLLVIIYLLNPFIQNINLFEFHILPFAIPLLLFAFYFYQTKKILPFYIFIILSLLVREDVALVIFMFGILALADYWQQHHASTKLSMTSPDTKYQILNTRYFLKWVLLPMILAVAWFILATKISGALNPSGSYKFLVYYSWLGQTFPQIIANFFLHPLIVLRKILTIYNLGFIIGILIPFGFLPLLKPRYLILLLPPLLQTVLGMGGGEEIILTHYCSLFLPALFIALIFAIKDVMNEKIIAKWQAGLLKALSIEEKRTFAIILLIIAAIYSFFTLGPVAGSTRIIANYDQKNTTIRNYFLEQIPADAPTLTSLDFLPYLSSRESIYALHYIYLGQKQFGNGDYTLPDDTEYLLINFDDIINYDFEFQKQSGYSKYLSSAPDRLRNILTEKNFGLVDIIDSIALLKKNYVPEKNFFELNTSAYPIANKQEINLDNKIKFLGYAKELVKKRINNLDLTLYNLNLSWQAMGQMTENYQLKLTALDKNNKPIYKKYYPLAYGIYPTSEWKINEIIQTNYWFLLPNNALSIEFNLVKIYGASELNDLRSGIIVIDREEQLGETIKIE